MRADAVLSPCRPGRESVAATVRSHLYLTISGYTTVPPLRRAPALFGADRLMFSTGHPFGDPARHAAFPESAPPSPEDRAKIGHGNADRVFGL